MKHENDNMVINDSGYKVFLASGAKIGQTLDRCMLKNYKQSMNPDHQVVVRKPADKLSEHYMSTDLLSRKSASKAIDILHMSSTRSGC